MEISNMTLGELIALDQEVAAMIKRRERAERLAAIEKIYSIANQVGIPLKTLLTKGGDSGKKSENLYRDPANPMNKWVGRGPRPAWLKEALANGKTLADFRV